jgi:hypothetical protein
VTDPNSQTFSPGASTATPAPGGRPDGPSGSAALSPFVPARLRRQVWLDSVARWAPLVLVILLIFGAPLEANRHDALWTSLPMVLILAAWAWGSTVNARVARALPQITAQLDGDPAAAEAGLGEAIRRWPLQQSLRLLLYHRLAILRHRQQRFAETAAICQTVLSFRLGPAGGVRGHLLLMLIESRLRCGDIHGAGQSLAELDQQPLSLAETLQRSALEVRWYVASGQPQAALQDLERRVQLAELMPPVQGGALHALLGAAAQSAGRPRTAAWLRQRADLLCTPEQLRDAQMGT